MSRCLRFLVSGRVQGVYFRASARARALELGLLGYARNLDDGRVEVLACGDSSDLERFRQWLHQGPPQARVTALESEPLTVPPAVDSFQIV